MHLNSENAKTLGRELAEIVKASSAPLLRRIEALEAEVRAGHERLKSLEGNRADGG